MYIAKRENFVAMRLKGLTLAKIAASLHISIATAKRWSSKLKKHELFKPKVKGGRPKKANAREMRAIKREAERNGIRRAVDICREAQVKVSHKTASKYLKSLDVKHLTRPIELPLSEINLQKRLNWSADHLGRDETFWKRIVWTDETMIWVMGGNQRRTSWVTKRTRYSRRNVRIRQKQGGGKVMFWGCFTAHGPGLLIPIEGNMKAKDYLKLLKDHVLPWIRRKELEIGMPLIFQQDNAPVHTAKICQEFWASNNVELLYWPPISPDLSPIENLWSILKARICESFPIARTTEDLKRIAQMRWLEISQELCSKLALGLPKRIEECIEREGWKIRR